MVSIGLMESNVTVQESVRSVVVCVRISKRIARAPAFRVTTRNGTAKGELYNHGCVNRAILCALCQLAKL